MKNNMAKVKKLSTRQELFCLNLFQGMTQTEAYVEAGYVAKSARFHASRLATKGNILARIQEFQKKAEDALIMDVIERKRRLSEIARGRLVDFVECGADGSYINIGLETTHSAALQAVKSRTEYNDDKSEAAVITEVKLHDPIRAIAELNKMEKIYEAGASVLVDNRTLTINVLSDRGKSLTQRLIQGERTIITEEVPDGDNGHKDL